MKLDPAAVRAGDRRALARAITLIESTKPDHRAEADALLADLLPATGGAIRIGISGVPGVGKSTFIEAFGLHLVDAGLKLAVLAVDPSSPLGGGSILGDKTRMEILARRPEAFIRPSPAGRTLGGVARRSRESLLLCEAAGFDVVVVETVGVGQSETAVAEMVDVFLLLLLPSAGDELQGIKKGIVELADALVINKADGESVNLAAMTRKHYTAAMTLLRHALHWSPQVMTCSALEGENIDTVWDMVTDFEQAAKAGQAFQARRDGQSRDWMHHLVNEMLQQKLDSNGAARSLLPALERQVVAGEITPYSAARKIIDCL
jgi:LAO/AO transport system kinase